MRIAETTADGSRHDAEMVESPFQTRIFRIQTESSSNGTEACGTAGWSLMLRRGDRLMLPHRLQPRMLRD